MAMARVRNVDQAREQRAAVVVVAALLLINVATAVAVVYSRHEARNLFVQLEQRKSERDAIAVEWDRLQLEEGTFATHSLIEGKARAKLGMAPPPFDRIEHITP
jgi:cell division protein FtsL